MIEKVTYHRRPGVIWVEYEDVVHEGSKAVDPKRMALELAKFMMANGYIHTTQVHREDGPGVRIRFAVVDFGQKEMSLP